MASSALTVTRLPTPAALRASFDEWAELHDRSGSTNPFAGPEWPLLWFEQLRDASQQPWVLQIRSGEELVGVLPLYRQSSRFGPALLVSPGAAAPWVAPFELPAPLVHPEHARPAMRAVMQYLAERSRDWDWVDLQLGDATPWFEHQWLPAGVATAVQRKGAATVVLPLDGADVKPRRNLKESVRRARNRLTKAYGADGWSVRRVTNSAEVPAAMDRLVALHRSRSLLEGKPVHGDAFTDPVVTRYVSNVVERMAERDRATVYELAVGDDVITSLLVMATATASYISVSGMAPEAWEYSPTTYLQWIAVEDAAKAGHVEMNMSVGPSLAKMRFSEDVRHYLRFSVVGSRKRSQTLFRVASARSATRDFDSAFEAQRPEPGGS